MMMRFAERYYRRGMERVRSAGYIERYIEIHGRRTAFAEGPNAGPPLVLLHGQGSRWQDHLRVLPSLARDHHVYAIDVYGHGRSARLPPDQYTARAIAELLAEFLRTAVGEPAILAGHSSGAVLAAAIAASEPELVRALLLEDPPFFSSIAPRAHRTVGGDIARVAEGFLGQDDDRDFPRYFVGHSSLFDLFGPLRRPIARAAVRHRDHNPRRPIQLWFAPGDLNIFLRGIEDLDPAFAAAWRDGHWYRGFDTGSTLAAITTPTALIHTDFWSQRFGSYYDHAGTLMAAMDGEDLARTRSLLRSVEVTVLPVGHLVHFVRPDAYLEVVRRLEYA